MVNFNAFIEFFEATTPRKMATTGREGISTTEKTQTERNFIDRVEGRSFVTQTRHETNMIRNHPWFDYPPAFEKRVKRMLKTSKKLLNPAIILEPLPPALKYSLTRNFGFVSSVFTQFLGNDGVSNVQESIGLSK